MNRKGLGYFILPFVSLFGILLLSNQYMSYIEQAMTHFNYSYFVMCMYSLLKAIWFFLTALIYLRLNCYKQKDNKNIIELIQIVTFLALVILSPQIEHSFQVIFESLNYIFLWILLFFKNIYFANKKGQS